MVEEEEEEEKEKFDGMRRQRRVGGARHERIRYGTDYVMADEREARYSTRRYLRTMASSYADNTVLHRVACLGGGDDLQSG